MGNNLKSLHTITSPIDMSDIDSWFMSEIKCQPLSIQKILSIVLENDDDFIKWPQKAILLWKGADRIPDFGKKIKYHYYPFRPLLFKKNQAYIQFNYQI